MKEDSIFGAYFCHKNALDVDSPGSGFVECQVKPHCWTSFQNRFCKFHESQKKDI